jgi:hypothetical protein
VAAAEKELDKEAVNRENLEDEAAVKSEGGATG